MAEQKLSQPGSAKPKKEPVFKVKIEYIWFSVPILLVVWFGFLKQVQLLDFWWHLKAGEIIVTTGSIPRVDMFSYTADGREFILQNWLAEVIYYLLYRAGGLPLLIVFNTMVLVLALLPIYSLCRRAAGSLRAGVVTASLGAISLIYLSHIRSQVFSFLFFSVFYWVLANYRDRRRDRLWLMPLLTVAWVNLHGAFVLGLGLAGLYLGCEIIRRIVLGTRPDTLLARELGRLALFIALSGIATLLNPETYRIYEHVMAVAADPVSQASVIEWQAPRVDDAAGVLTFFGPFFITLLVLLYSKRRPGLTDLVIVLVFTVFALTAVRNGIWFGLIAAPVVARYARDIDWAGIFGPLLRYRLVDSLVARIERRRQAVAPIRYRVNFVIAAVMLYMTIALTPWVRPLLGNPILGSSLIERKTPVKVMDYIQAQNLQGRIFHPQIYGDYLIWRLWPQHKTFFDGRVHLFGEAIAKDYRDGFRDSHWEEILGRYEIRYLLLSNDEQNNRAMIESARASSGWRLLYEDELSVLFEKSQ